MADRHTSDMRCESGTLRAIGSHPRATRPTEHARDDASSRRTQIASIVQSTAVRDLPDCKHSTHTGLQDEPQTVGLCAQLVRWTAVRLSYHQLRRHAFADEWSWNGAGEPLGKREVHLLDNEPHMPTLQAMHRALAKHPMLQVELFLLLDELVHAELCCMEAFIGMRKYGIRNAEQPVREDDFASSIQIGIAQFPRSALKPLEAQGRGFTHGHEKIISVPRTRAARLKQLFTKAAATEHGEDELSR